MSQDQLTFYNNESAQYSKKRYEGALLSYTQYLFRTRLSIFIRMLERAIGARKNISIFEIGCADGVILQAIAKTFPDSIQNMVGIDISQGMIETAAAYNQNKNISFALRGLEENRKYDMVIELGVHVPDLQKEIGYVKSRLVEGGYFIYSVAGRKSSHVMFKRKNDAAVKDYLTYEEAEKILKNNFDIVDAVPYGLFVPKLWTSPSAGRFFQPLFDVVFRHIAPELFHEKIYLLRNKS